MKIILDGNTRKTIEIEIELNGKKIKLVYKQNTTKQNKEIRKKLKTPNAKLFEVDELSEKHFFENLEGDEKDIAALVEFYEDGGDFNDFVNACNTAMGKQKNKA